MHTIVTNLEGTEIVLDHCSRFGKRVLVASTSEVYGDPRTEEPLPRGRPASLRPDHSEALAVRRLEGDGRVPGAGLPPGARPRLRDRPPLQHRRAPAERSVRDGRSPSSSRRPLAGRAAGDPRRRDADPHLLPCARHDLGPPGWWTSRTTDGQIYNVGSPNRISILELAAARARGDRLVVGARRRPVRPGLRARDRGHAPPRSRRSRRSTAAIGWAPRAHRSTRSSPT